MLTALVVVFIVAYAAIALEHPLKINKSASALVGQLHYTPARSHRRRVYVLVGNTIGNIDH